MLDIFLMLAIASVAPDDIFYQYGAIGAIALLALYAVARLFKRQEKLHERDIARAERAEEQLNQLNQIIRDQIVVQLTRATDAISRVTDVMSDARRDRDR